MLLDQVAKLFHELSETVRRHDLIRITRSNTDSVRALFLITKHKNEIVLQSVSTEDLLLQPLCSQIRLYEVPRFM